MKKEPAIKEQEKKVATVPEVKEKDDKCIAIEEEIKAAPKDEKPENLSLLHKRLGDCLAREDKGEKAIEAYNKALSYPYSVLSISTRLKIAEYIGNMDHYDEAITELKKIIQHDRTNQKAYILTARFLSWKGDQSQAERYIDVVLQQDPQNSEALLIKADILNYSGRSEKAIPIYDDLLAKGDNFYARFGLTIAYINLEQFSEAEENLNKLEERKKERLAQNLESAKSEAPAKELKKKIAYAIKLSRKKCFAAAYCILNGILRSDPCHVEARIALGRVLGWDGRYFEAIKQLNCVLLHDPCNTDAMFAKATVLRWKRDFPGSTHLYKELLCLDPENYDAQMGLAYLYLSRSYHLGAHHLINSIISDEIYQEEEVATINNRIFAGPEADFEYTHFRDSDDIRTDYYLLTATERYRDWEFDLHYMHVRAVQPTGNIEVTEKADTVGFDALKLVNACLDIGGGIGFANTTERNFYTANAIVNLRTPYGLFELGSERNIIPDTAAAIFFKISTWTNYIYYTYVLSGNTILRGNYVYTKYSDANHANRVNLSAQYQLIDSCFEMYCRYDATYWNFAGQPFSPFVDPSVFSGAHGYFDPKNYLRNKVGLPIYYRSKKLYVYLHPYGAYATYHVLGIHYNGFYYAANGEVRYRLLPKLFIEASGEAGSLPLKNLKYNYSIISGRLTWVF